MKSLRKLLLALLVLLLSVASAQAVTRVLVLPFETEAVNPNYSLGLAGGLQRSLNSIEGIYVPPVGDGALFAARAFDLDLDPLTASVAAFDAHAIVSGEMVASGDSVNITLAFSGPRFAELTTVTVSAPNVPSSLMRATVDEVVRTLGLNIDSATQSRIDTINSQAPSATSMGPIGMAMARLGGTPAEVQSAFESDSNSSWVQGEYARVQMLAGNAEAALQAANRAVELNPGDVEAVVNRGIVLTQLDRLEEATAAYNAALELNSWHATALAAQALITTDLNAARSRLERSIEAYPRLADAYLDLVLLEPNDTRALQQLRRAAEHLPESIQIHRAFVLRTLAAGDANGALAYLRSVAADPLGATPALYSLASNLPADLTDQAMVFVNEGANRFPQSTLPGLTESFLLRRAGRAAEAEAILRSLHTAHPGDLEVANQLAITLGQLGRVDEARQVFESIAGASSVVTLNLAQTLLEDGQAAAALQLLEPLAGAADADADTVTLYGIALARTGQTAAAETAFNHALGLDPDWHPARAALAQLGEQSQVTGGVAVQFTGEAGASFQRGLTALNNSDFQTAVIEFGTAADLSGEALAHFYRGYSLQLLGRVREAVAAYELALAGFPNSDIVLNNLGYSQLVLGRYDLALPLLTRAVEANAGNGQAHMNYGLAQYGLGRFSAALESWETAVRLEPALSASLDELMQDARSRLGN